MIPATCPGIPPCNLDYCLMCQWQSCTNYISCIESYEIFLWIVLHDQNMHSTCYDQTQKTTQNLSYPDLWCNQFPVRGTTLRCTLMKETQLWFCRSHICCIKGHHVRIPSQPAHLLQLIWFCSWTVTSYGRGCLPLDRTENIDLTAKTKRYGGMNTFAQYMGRYARVSTHGCLSLYTKSDVRLAKFDSVDPFLLLR